MNTSKVNSYVSMFMIVAFVALWIWSFFAHNSLLNLFFYVLFSLSSFINLLVTYFQKKPFIYYIYWGVIFIHFTYKSIGVLTSMLH